MKFWPRLKFLFDLDVNFGGNSKSVCLTRELVHGSRKPTFLDAVASLFNRPLPQFPQILTNILTFRVHMSVRPFLYTRSMGPHRHVFCL